MFFSQNFCVCFGAIGFGRPPLHIKMWLYPHPISSTFESYLVLKKLQTTTTKKSKMKLFSFRPTTALHGQMANTNFNTSVSSSSDLFLRKVENSIQRNLENERFDVPQLARMVHLSVSQLNRRLNSLINNSAGSLIRERRLQHAAWLLANGVGSIGDIAYQVGYKDQAHFCRSFKRKFGCSPSGYMKRKHFVKTSHAQKGQKIA